MIYGRILLLIVHAKHSRAEADIQRFLDKSGMRRLGQLVAVETAIPHG